MNPYAPPSFAVVVPSPRLASLGRRFGAHLMDAIALLVCASVVSRAVAAIAGIPHATWMVSSCLVIPSLVQWFLVTTRGQSLGKIVLGTRIVRSDGRPVGFLHGVVLREMPVLALQILPSFVPALRPLATLFLLADALIVFTDARRTLHDRVADTVVVDV